MSDQETGGASAPDANASQAKPATDVAVPKPGSEADSSTAAKAVPSDTSKPKKSEDDRYGELTRRWREEQRRSDRLMRQNEELVKRLGVSPGTPQQPQQQQAPSRKTLKDFNYDGDAYSEYLFTEAADKAAKVAEAKALEAFQKQSAATRRSTYETRAQAFAQSVEDFDDVIRGEWACSEPMAEVIEESEEGPALAYYLAQNPEIASKLAQLSAAQSARELTRIEDRLVAERKAASQKPVSQAPPPPPSIEGSDAGNVERDPTKMTQKQFNKWREGFIGKRR